MTAAFVFPQAQTFGGLWVGIAATITGSANDVVVDFTGTTQTLFDAPSVAVPVLATHSGTDGSTFKIQMEGVWVAKFRIYHVTASSVLAAIGIDNVAGDLTIDPPVETTRILDRDLSVQTTADTATLCMISDPFVVTRNMAQDATLGIVRCLASNNAGAGAADASILVAPCSLRLTRICGIPASDRG